MVSARTGGRGRPRKKNREEEAEGGLENEGGNVITAEYEESRAQRIRENAERMRSLGLLDLAKNLKPRASKLLRKTKPATPTLNDPPRRSSRLKDLPTVSYTQKKIPKKIVVENVEIHIEKGENPEIYTDEHKKLLGDSRVVWQLYVDGFDEDGQLIYHPVEGKSCHQCRQKTLGLHTKCSKCDTCAGQFCGDCLYMRYGENVKEVNQNPGWVCPTCRGLCNCSRCRRDKGWMPTGAIYNKVSKLGFKSVAHYLVHTLNEHAVQVVAADNPISSVDSIPASNGEEESTGTLSIPSSVGEKNKRDIVEMRQDSDEDYRGDEYEEEDGEDVSNSESDSQSEN